MSHSSCCFGTADCFSRATGAFSHILPRPRETLTDEPRSNARTHVSTRARRLTHSRLSLLLPGVSEKTRRPLPRFDWSQAKHFSSPFLFTAAAAFFSHPSPPPPPKPVFFFFPRFGNECHHPSLYSRRHDSHPSPPGKPQPKPPILFI